MTSWTVKTLTDDPTRALEIVQDQRNRGNTAWIEDEHGKGIDERSLKAGDVTLTNDPARALEIIQDQQNRENTALIEDDHGKGIDEQSLKTSDVTITKALRDKVIGLLFLLGAVVAGLGILYLLGWWVDD